MPTLTATKQPYPTPALADPSPAPPGTGLREELLRKVQRGWTVIEIPGWVIQVRQTNYLRVKGWWAAARDCGINHQARPILLYRISETPWRAMLALRDLRPDLGDAHPRLSVETDLDGLIAVLERTQIKPRLPGKK